MFHSVIFLIYLTNYIKKIKKESLQYFTAGQTHETFIFPFLHFRVFIFFSQVFNFIIIAISSSRNDG